ncbi:tetratricopeptide repeat protein [Mesorhizobium sp. ES1-1]|uniref:tetratricopeptide repeat protein n=1 Tax=Mesorhizobium sp. ES1-1 TaxID=2876629 RepID=UPI001CCA2524|nr:cellulose synthase [Mesorhizobium sp. ES1-1]MBZ9674324.1 cellulose synthase [Mesorhizobium sp. ES1-1]
MKPVLFIAVGILALGALVIHKAGYLDSGALPVPPTAPNATVEDQAQGGSSQPTTVAQQAPAPAAQDTPVPAAPAASSGPATAPQADAAAPKVDETALRYFAAKGDTRRLEAEIARLKALYPEWTPPDNPLAFRQGGDPQLDQMWKLYSEDKLAEVRKAIADRQAAQSGWQPPADLLERLAVAEAREQLVNASDLKQYDAVIRIGSANASLLTCGDVDVLWRVAEAFANTDRKGRARDAYLYVLNTCKKPEERVATIQKALPLLPRQDLDQLLATERKTADGKGEFEAVRGDIARQSLANADADPKLVISPEDIATVKALADKDGLASDDMLLGWYYVRRENPKDAETWFRKARDKENTAAASQGLALALIQQSRSADAEAILYEWRDANDDVRRVYLAAVANLLAVTPPVPLAPEVLQRMVQAIYAAKDPAAAQQLGWYADGLSQSQTAAQWFRLALDWKPDDEPSAYGLALSLWKTGDKAGAREIQAAWIGRSERIPTVGERSVETAAVGRRARNAARARAQDEDQRVAVEQPTRPASDGRASPQARGCLTSIDPSTLSPEQALTRAWCLMGVNRPVEAAAAFEVALRGTGKTQADAAYGQSLAYLRAGLTDMAAVAASKAPMDADRSVGVRTLLLENQATTAFNQGRYVEALMALDERSRIAPERTGLMVLRGYAYLKLRRYGDAEQVFRAAAGTGNHDALKGLNDVKTARETKIQ